MLFARSFPFLASGRPERRASRHNYWKRSPISLKDYGKLHFRVATDAQRLLDERGEPLTLKDLFSHMSILGGSGAGKTRYVLTQVLESTFRATDLRNPEERERLKLAAFVLDGKCELTPVVRWLAERYGRMEDVLLFGPGHPLALDPFNDPDASPSELADLMITLKQALDDGKTSPDPFWDAAGRKLFACLFHLHRQIQRAAEEGLVANPPPPMSFHLLNLLVMDRGQPINQNAIDRANSDLQALREKLIHAFEDVVRLVNHIEVDLFAWANELRCKPHKMTHGEEGDQAKELRLLERNRIQSVLALVDGDKKYSPNHLAFHPIAHFFEGARAYRNAVYQAPIDETFYERLSAFSLELRSRCRQLAILAGAPGLAQPQLRELFLSLLEKLEYCLSLSFQMKETQVPEPEYGLLQRWVDAYETILRKRGQDPWLDETYLYFRGEYLNIANERTAGSIGMTVSTLTSLMTQPPFDSLVKPGGTLRFRDLIDQGKILVLDMNFARWRSAAKVASILLKLDFFRTVLSRKALKRADGRPINQERPILYLCDEFATVATTGDWTGERGFLDKAREYRCACVLAFQSLAVLESRMIRPEIEAILTNTGTMIFLRNPHPDTNEFASKIAGETERGDGYLVRGTQELMFDLTKPVAHQDYQIVFRREPRYPPWVFPQLKDGEAIVKLPARFGSRAIKRVQFLLHLIPR